MSTRQVAVVMGSDSDLPVVTRAIETLSQMGVDAEVRVPRDLDVAVLANNGPVCVRGLRSRVSAKLSNGAVRIEDVISQLTIGAMRMTGPQGIGQVGHTQAAVVAGVCVG